MRIICSKKGIFFTNQKMQNLWSKLLVDVEDVDLSGYDFDTEELEKISKKLKKNSVKSLDISNNSFKTKELKILADGFGKSKILESLDMSQNDISSGGIKIFSKFFSSPSLVTLDLSMNDPLNDEGVSLLVKCISKNEMLKNLYLSNCGFTDTGIKEITKLLTNKKLNLKRLDVSGNLISKEGSDVIFESLMDNSKLKVLKMSGAKLFPEEIIYMNTLHDDSEDGDYVEKSSLTKLYQMLAKNNSLKQLNLNNCSLKELDLIDFFLSLETNDCLEILNLQSTKRYHSSGNYKITNVEKNNKLLPIIKNMKSLRVLNLQHYDICPYLLDLISKGLEFNTSLQILNLAENIIRSLPQSLFDSLGKNTTLKELYLNKNGLTIQDLIDLFVALDKNKGLEKLDISVNGIDLDATKVICKYLSNNNSLRVLKMDFCGMDLELKMMVLDSLQTNTTLQVLSMQGDEYICKVRDQFEAIYRSISNNFGLEELLIFDEQRRDLEKEKLMISGLMERNVDLKNIKNSFKHVKNHHLTDIHFSFVYMAYKRPLHE
jgi:Ran GTPase-activating protein (RanGAP) involved in mRNA processing and transport